MEFILILRKHESNLCALLLCFNDGNIAKREKMNMQYKQERRTSSWEIFYGLAEDSLK